ncbi:MAG: glycosyltransferase family 2 protein [Clostridiales bacterium]|jgi:glycosyltransferase involved in cell wall biosynthesis|nr:glycosyltransferase family 2 protein [Clostridiales bacterium]
MKPNNKLYEFYQASPMKEGILCWYPFEKDIDYKIVIDPEDFSVEALRGYKNELSPHGRLLLAYENPFALRYWSGQKSPETGLPYSSLLGREGQSGRVSKAELQIRLQAAGFEGQKWYYPLTDHWFAREIYSDAYLPNEFLNQRLVSYILNDDNLQFDESLLYREVIRGGAFEFMCGAYLAEARVCVADAPCPVDYAAVTAYRSSAKRFATTVRNDGTVRKMALHPDGQKSLLQILQNHEELANFGVDVLPVKLEGNALVMERLNQPTLWDYWAKKVALGTIDFEEVTQQFDNIRSSIYKASAKGNCYWELVPANCFYNEQNKKLNFFDQEYYWENHSPDLALVRALLSFRYSRVFREFEHSEKWIAELKNRYNLTEKWDEYIKLTEDVIFHDVFADGDLPLKKETEKAAQAIRKNEELQIAKRRKEAALLQGKVSMVMACYNKEEYIGVMLESILNQEWDNIELILVNDGSTDGTRQVISSFEERLAARGYKVVIIDQVNKGACAAVREGLKRITGKYINIVDADDELDSKYISTMAKWLEEHDEYEYCSCDYYYRSADGSIKFNRHPMYMNGEYSLELFLAKNTNRACWNFLVRTSYFNKCNIINNYEGLGHCTYEPGFSIPLAAYKGKMKAFDEPLYIYNIGIDGMSRESDEVRFLKYVDEYFALIVSVFDALPNTVVDIYQKQFLLGIASFQRLVSLYGVCRAKPDGKRSSNLIFDELLSFINNWLGICPKITIEQIGEDEYSFIEALVFAFVKGLIPQCRKQGRIIGYGALGKSAAKMLPKLKGTLWEPSVLWDKDGGGGGVALPNIAELTENDIVFVFPAAQEVVDEIKCLMEKCPAAIWYRYEIDEGLKLSKQLKVLKYSNNNLLE